MKPHHYTWIASVSLIAVLAFPVYSVFHGLNEAITDARYYRWDREHHLTHGYRDRQPRRLQRLQSGLLEYAQHHKGVLPPMNDTIMVQRLLMPYVKHPLCFVNMTTYRPFQPNATLSNRKYRSITNRNIIAFYDPNPPQTYPEVYYVTLNGKVDHVNIAQWPEVRQASGVTAP